MRRASGFFAAGVGADVPALLSEYDNVYLAADLPPRERIRLPAPKLPGAGKKLAKREQLFAFF